MPDSWPTHTHAGTGAAFTLLELITVILTVSILCVMLLPVLSGVQNRAAKAQCIANLKSLHVAANLYVQDHHAWPQVKNSGVTTQALANDWIAHLQPYGLTQLNWICPTIQRLLNSPDLTDPNNARLDYIATPFDTNPQTPFKWNTQPWFAESGNVHGNGNLLIFSDGHTAELNDLLTASPSPAPGN